MIRHPINMTEDSEFFIALCTEKMHSYIVLGVKNGRKVEILTALGKSLNENSSLFGCAFWDTEAILQIENIMTKRNNRKADISYKAYSITYRNYMEFLNYLKILSIAQTKNKDVSPIRAYCPDRTTPDAPWTIQSVEQLPSSGEPPNDPANESFRRLSGLSNNCRHSAIRLTKKATSLQDLGQGISSLFFKNPPLKAVFSSGKLDEMTPYFYILPTPPKAFLPMEKNKFRVINALYKRLDALTLTQQENHLTNDKFQKLKALYNNLTRSHSASMLEILSSIVDFAKENKRLVETHRESHWFSFQTATQKMFAKLHEEFEQLQSNQAQATLHQ